INITINKWCSHGGDNMALSVEDLKAIESLLEPIKRDLRNIQMTLENETNRNIKLIAEGHLDLSRKLNEALKADTEKEMLLIRVNILENELRKVKERIESIA
ncbi:MAG: hypothetical protein K2J04_09240, partial [Lachnospiraceae bacterium]|nr:hypothetical protein [Lachnospiraceae bacterium]